MDPVRNPYSPGAGSKPPALTGRDSELEAFRVLLQRLQLGRSEKSMIITGLRGVGKTVLLNTFEGIAEDNHFRTAKAEITHETDFGPMVARMTRRVLLSISAIERMNDRARRAASVLKAFTIRLPEGPELGFDVEPALGQADSGNLPEDLSDLFVALGEAAKEHGTGAALLLDEVQFLRKPELEALIAALHQTSQRSLPITLVGAGLPQLPSLTGSAKSYSERLFDFPSIGKLSDSDAQEALAQPAEREGVTFDPLALKGVIDYTEGYPYFLQEYGKHAWNLAKGDVITSSDVERALDRVETQLDDNFFRVRVARCTNTELRYLSAMAELGEGPYRSGEIATRLGRPGPENVAPTRGRLIAKGLIYSPSHGLNGFTVPQFARFMRRLYPLDELD